MYPVGRRVESIAAKSPARNGTVPPQPATDGETQAVLYTLYRNFCVNFCVRLSKRCYHDRQNADALESHGGPFDCRLHLYRVGNKSVFTDISGGSH